MIDSKAEDIPPYMNPSTFESCSEIIVLILFWKFGYFFFGEKQLFRFTGETELLAVFVVVKTFDMILKLFRSGVISNITSK